MRDTRRTFSFRTRFNRLLFILTTVGAVSTVGCQCNPFLPVVGAAVVYSYLRTKDKEGKRNAVAARPVSAIQLEPSRRDETVAGKFQAVRGPDSTQSIDLQASPKRKALADFGEGRRAYRYGRFGDANRFLRRSLGSGELSRRERRDALPYAAASSYFLNDTAEASRFLRRLYVLDPDHVLDEKMFPPPFRAFAKKLRK